jgi:hypothetical protein
LVSVPECMDYQSAGSHTAIIPCIQSSYSMTISGIRRNDRCKRDSRHSGASRNLVRRADCLENSQMSKLDSDIRKNDSPRRADEPAAFCRRYPPYVQPSAGTGSDHGFRMIAGQRSAQDG